jgi:hypothetical protein
VFVCSACGEWNIAPELIEHHSSRCPGRSDERELERVQAVKLRSRPYDPSERQEARSE